MHNYPMSKAPDKNETEINIIVFILAALSVAASLNPQWHLWGLDSPKSFPIWIGIAFLVPLLILAIPQIASKIGGFIANFLTSLSKTNLALLYALLALTLFMLFIVFTSHNYFMGDAYNIQGNIKGGRFFSPTEPLDYFVHQVIFRMLGKNSDKAAYRAYAISSYFCGAVFLWMLYYFIKDKIRLILSLGVVLCFAAIQFFFGYVENYTFSFTLIFFYSLSAIRDLNSKRLSAMTIALLLVACAFQVSLAILIPSCVLLMTLKDFSGRKYLIMILMAVLVALAGTAYLAFFGQTSVAGIMVPLTELPENPYALFSGQHLYDLLNLILLNYPLLIVIFFLRSLRRKMAMPFYLLLLVPGLLFVILVDPKLGAFRDWDLTAIAAAPMLALLVSSLAIEDGKGNRRRYSMFIALGLFGILHTGGWIFQNASQEKSYAAVKEAVGRDMHYSGRYMAGARNKSWAKLAYDLGQDLEEAIRAEYERYLANPQDTVNTSQLADELFMAGDTSRAVEIISGNWVRFKGVPRAILIMGRVLVRAGLYDEAGRMYHDCLSLSEEEPMLYYALGDLKRLQGQRDSAFYYFDKAYALTDASPIDKQYQFYLTCFAYGYDDLAQKGFARIMPRLTSFYKRYADLVLMVLKKGNAAGIDSLRASLIKAMGTP
jgi:hypothetical protein